MTEKPRHKYKIRYTMTNPEFGEFIPDDTPSLGLTDQLLIASVLLPEDGSRSQAFMTWDGKNEGKQWSAEDLFKFWTLMAHNVASHPDMPLPQVELAEYVFETVRQAVLSARREAGTL